MSKADRLRITWSKREHDVMYMLGEPLRKFLDEMERRGYDRSSLVLTIKRRPPAPTSGG